MEGIIAIRFTIAAIGGGLPWRRAGAADVAIKHRQEALGIGRVAGLDHDIEDKPRSCRWPG